MNGCGCRIMAVGGGSDNGWSRDGCESWAILGGLWLLSSSRYGRENNWICPPLLRGRENNLGKNGAFFNSGFDPGQVSFSKVKMSINSTNKYVFLI